MTKVFRMVTRFNTQNNFNFRKDKKYLPKNLDKNQNKIIIKKLRCYSGKKSKSKRNN